MRRSALIVIGLSTAAGLSLTGCASNAPKNVSPTSSATVSAVNKDQALADLVPSAIKTAGRLRVGINLPYAPNEYKDPSNKIVGWEPEFLDAVAKKLGLTTSYQESIFDNIIPGVKGAKYDVGMSSFTDNKTREQQAAFVNYYSAGFPWGAP